MNKGQVRFVPIGDSYTIGEGVSPVESWPVVLTRHLNEKGLNVTLVGNPARTGFTSRDAIDFELRVFESSKPGFGVLMVGVNDFVQGISEEDFRLNLVFLIEEMQKQLPDKTRLLLVNIPDYSVTPTGAGFAFGRDVPAGLRRFNNIIEEEASRRGLKVVDVYSLSLEMGKDGSLVASDGLHPSGKEYALWEERIFPLALDLLEK